MELKDFDAIRPFEPEELPAAYERLLGDRQFQQVLDYLYPQVTHEQIGEKMRACRNNLEFQKAFSYGFLKKLMAQASKGMDINVESIDPKRRYTFVSNHRDIVLDSALLDVLLIDAGFDTTCEIAIGDNLLSLPWVKDLVRINKSFIVERSLSPRQMLAASKRMGNYMHYVIGQKNDNVWIAQREGRAKDSNDRTQPAILKMMAMGGEGSVCERLKQLHIVPLSISYELDPCDYLKAREMQLNATSKDGRNRHRTTSSPCAPASWEQRDGCTTTAHPASMNGSNSCPRTRRELTSSTLSLPTSTRKSTATTASTPATTWHST